VIVWSAGADGGAFAATIAERTGKEGCRRKGDRFSIPPSRFLLFTGWRSQQCAIATAHQGEAGLNQTNGSITQVVGFPGAFGDLFGTKQDFGDFAVCTAIHPRIKRTKRERQATAALRGKHMQRWSRWTVVQCSPKPPCCVRTKFEVAVEWKFDRIGFGDDRWLPQPQAVLDAAQMQHGVPAVGRLPQLSGGQFARLKTDASVSAERHRRTNWDHRRQHLRRP
jgi:hypothetical protein